MTYKAVVYTSHAVGRMELRGFSRTEIRALLVAGRKERGYISSTSPDLLSKLGEVRGRAARVVYLEDAHEITVVTIMWVE